MGDYQSLQEIFLGSELNLTITDKNEIMNKIENDIVKMSVCYYDENIFIVIIK